ncbi:MAG: hypothetical protein WC223_12180 [Bacteroidales bacterium]|jgi:hypothetical protein
MKLLLTISLFILTNIVFADIWPEPKTQRYFSNNKYFFIEVIPRKIPEKYFNYIDAKHKHKNLKKFKQIDTILTPCTATLYEIKNADTIAIWSRQLINIIAPSYVTVSNDGKFIATFDNWGSMGYGLDVFVVYNNIGDLLKRYKLDDITPFPLNSYQLSISSIWWRGDVTISEASTGIEICFIDKDKNKKCRNYDLTKLKFEDEH